MTLRSTICHFIGMVAVIFAVGASAENRVGVAKISSTPAGAVVYIAGREYGRTPVFVELAAGKHKMTVSLDGYPPETKLLSVLPGRVSYAKVKFKGASRSKIRVHDTSRNGEDAGPGTVNVATDPPGLTVRMNKEIVPKPTPVSFDLAAGVYTMTIEKDGDTLVKKTVFVRAGRTIELDLTVKNRRRIDEEDPWK
jgi:hypothetical protein